MENSVRDVERQIMLVVVGEYVYKVVSHLRLVTVSIFIVCLCWCLHVIIPYIYRILLSLKSQGGTV